MWQNTEHLGDSSDYDSRTIKKFISNRSTSVAEKIRKLIQMDIVLKSIVGLILALDVILFYNDQYTVSVICMIEILVLIPLIRFEWNLLGHFNDMADYRQNTREKLSNLLTFLRSRFFTGLLSISSTYLFGFTGGMLAYFYVAYGYLRRLDNMDVFVFSTICLIGIIMNFVTYQSLVKYQEKHLEACLSDLNEESLLRVSKNIEEKQKQDKLIKGLITAVLILGLLVFIAVLKVLGV